MKIYMTEMEVSKMNINMDEVEVSKILQNFYFLQSKTRLTILLNLPLDQ